VAAPFGFSEHVEGKTTVLDLRGNFDRVAVPVFRAGISRLVEVNTRDVIVDLSAVEFLDSSGVGVMVAARLILAGLNGALYVRNAHGQVAEVLALTGVGEAFAVPD
jgi:anti-sigma B factor antagonist